MPKIVIKETDKTSAGSIQYTNFTVVVPGLVAVGKDTDFFDENGIYKFESKSDFVEKVGKVSSNSLVITKAVRPTLVSWGGDDSEDSDSDWEEDVAKIDRTLFERAFNDPDVVLCEARERTKGASDYGSYFDENYSYEKVEDETSFRKSKWYAQLDVHNTGVDEERGTHYGNQIAYELLGMGYTVLYKKFDSSESLGSDSFWEPLKDKATYDFRYIINGALTGNSQANSAIIDLATFINSHESDSNGRGDCIALVDIDSDEYDGKTTAVAIEGIKEGIQGIKASKYAAIFAPYVEYSMPEDDVYKTNRFPASFHYLACAARSFETYNEWYAVAGYTRGISNYSIAKTGVKLGDIAVDTFQPRFIKYGVEKAVNLIVKIKDSYYLWGNRTAEALGVEGDNLRASHFLNIRQLCTTIKKQVYVACRRFTYDPNSDTLWTSFCNAIRPTLEKMKADQGIKDYKFVKVATTEKAVLKARIRIIPIEAVEDFDITLSLEDSLGNTVAELGE